MEQEFYRGRLRDQHHLDVLIPDDADRGVVHKIIYEELCLGLVRDASRAEYRRIIQRLVDQGAQGVILGCTEISMLVGQSDSPVPLFDTTAIHASKAAEWALTEEVNFPGQR
jgi:aspartate racemase